MSQNLIVKRKKGKNAHQNPLQETFSRLKKRIDSLQKECLECEKTLDRHLNFYDQILAPKVKQSGEFLRQEIKIFYPYLKDKRNLKKKDRDTLESLLEGFFDKIFSMEGPDMALDEELLEINKEIIGFSFQDQQKAEFEAFKKSTEEQFAKKGVHINLDEIKMEGSQADTIARLIESMQQQGAFFEKEEEVELPKEKGKHLLEMEALQKKEIGTIYKQLAKVLHPDLEIDPDLKAKKEGLMKKLTSAYEDRDLHTLLSLEIETLSLSSNESKTRTEDQLKVFNHLLQTQVNELQEKLNSIPMDYKYSILHGFTHYRWKKGDHALHQIQKAIEENLRGHKQIMKQCQNGNALQAVKGLIESYKALYGHNDCDRDYF